MTHPPASDQGPPVAAVVHDGRCDVDAARGVRHPPAQRRAHRAGPRDAAPRAGRGLPGGDGADRRRHRHGVPGVPVAGSQAASCRADPQGLRAGERGVPRQCWRAPDLVVCNRFGALEAEAAGFAAELLALLSKQGIPVLTVVGTRYAPGLAALRRRGGVAACRSRGLGGLVRRRPAATPCTAAHRDHWRLRARGMTLRVHQFAPALGPPNASRSA